MQEFYEKLLVPNYNNNWSLKVFKALQPRGMLLRTNLHGIGESFSKVSFLILTTFEFSRQKVDNRFLENGTFQSIPNLK